MEIVTTNQITEWLRLDPSTDTLTLEMLVNSAIDVIEHELGSAIRPYTDPDTDQTVTPIVPEAIRHAIAVHVGAHYDDRNGSTEAAVVTVKRLCAPFKVQRV